MSPGRRRRDADEVVRIISDAFSGTPYPGRDALFNDHCCECAEVSAAYAGKPWTDIALDDVRAGRETALLTAAAWRYYLPAVMIWCLRAPDAVDVIQDNLVYQLEPPAGGRGVPQWFEERAIGFSEAQQAAITAYLHWYREFDRERGGDTEPPRHVDNALAHWTPREPDVPPRSAIDVERVGDLRWDALEALVVESERDGLRFLRRLADEWASGANRFDRAGEALFAALLDGRLVGVCGLNVDPYAASPLVGRVRHLYVLTAHRRLGVGRRLVEEVIRVARNHFDTLRLRTHNPAAARLYEALGFRAGGAADCTHAMELR
jgi:GNAT superfamily N-acetyltransferase